MPCALVFLSGSTNAANCNRQESWEVGQKPENFIFQWTSSVGDDWRTTKGRTHYTGCNSSQCHRMWRGPLAYMALKVGATNSGRMVLFTDTSLSWWHVLSPDSEAVQLLHGSNYAKWGCLHLLLVGFAEEASWAIVENWTLGPAEPFFNTAIKAFCYEGHTRHDRHIYLMMHLPRGQLLIYRLSTRKVHKDVYREKQKVPCFYQQNWNVWRLPCLIASCSKEKLQAWWAC